MSYIFPMSASVHSPTCGAKGFFKATVRLALDGVDLRLESRQSWQAEVWHTVPKFEFARVPAIAEAPSTGTSRCPAAVGDDGGARHPSHAGLNDDEHPFSSGTLCRSPGRADLVAILVPAGVRRALSSTLNAQGAHLRVVQSARKVSMQWNVAMVSADRPCSGRTRQCLVQHTVRHAQDVSAGNAY